MKQHRKHRCCPRRDNEVPASSQPRGQQGTGKFLQNPGQPWPPPAVHSPARGSAPAPQPCFRVRQELGIHLPSARDAPQEERRGPGVCARPGPAHLARRVCFIFFFIIIIILQAEEPRKPNKGPAELGLPWERINKPRESTSCRGGADSQPGRAPRRSHPRPSALGTELKGLRGHGDSQSCGDSLRK